MLDRRMLVDCDGVRIADVACRHRRGLGQDYEQADSHAIVFVRRGCFVRRAEGPSVTLDPTLAYCVSPGQIQRYDHPHTGGDDCTALFLDEKLAASLWAGDQWLPYSGLAISPELDLEHRLLLTAARRGEDDHELAERAIVLSARALEQSDPRPVADGRPATLLSRRKLVDNVREALLADSRRSLPDLAGELAVSPHHLSRTFRSMTGHTISRYRIRLRVRAALERLAEGDRDLAWLAADLGLTDQSHLYRLVRSELDTTPLALRRALASNETAAC